MTKIKIVLVIVAFLVATFALSLRLARAENVFGWLVQPAAVYACDPANTSGCGG